MFDELHAELVPILRLALERAPIPRAGRILDLACGDAAKWPLYRELLGGTVDLIGVDRDQALLAAGHPLLALAVADAHALPFAPAVFGGALCVAALGSFAEPRQALGELRRVLRPGAAALIVTAERRWAALQRWPTELAARVERAAAGVLPPPAHPDLAGDLAGLLALAGFAAHGPHAFLLERRLPPRAAELALQPWGSLRPLLAQHLAPADLAACDALAEPEVELASIALAAAAVRPSYPA